jgi:hypothetical protein
MPKSLLFQAQSGRNGERFIAMAQAMGKMDAAKFMDFVDALVELQKACGVDDLKMSDTASKGKIWPVMPNTPGPWWVSYTPSM